MIFMTQTDTILREGTMAIIDQLRENKGTVSSQLGKDLAQMILSGKSDCLKEAIELSSYRLESKSDKNIRAGAAKIVECVAMEKPEMVTHYLEKLLPALDAPEPQTRWAIIRTFGFCAKLTPEIAKKAIPFARNYIHDKTEGQLCLVSSADLFLGDYGEISKKHAQEVLSILLESTDNVIANEHDWLIESFIKIAKHLTNKEKELIALFAMGYKDHSRKKTRDRVNTLLKVLSERKLS
jgi:hypothetical protein